MNIYDLQSKTEIVELNNAEASQISGGNNWFEEMALAWGQALDAQAQKINNLASQTGDNPSPEQISQLTAESLSLGHLSNASHTALTSIGSEMETLARKQ